MYKTVLADYLPSNVMATVCPRHSGFCMAACQNYSTCSGFMKDEANYDRASLFQTRPIDNLDSDRTSIPGTYRLNQPTIAVEQLTTIVKPTPAVSELKMAAASDGYIGELETDSVSELMEVPLVKKAPVPVVSMLRAHKNASAPHITTTNVLRKTTKQVVLERSEEAGGKDEPDYAEQTVEKTTMPRRSILKASSPLLNHSQLYRSSGTTFISDPHSGCVIIPRSTSSAVSTMVQTPAREASNLSAKPARLGEHLVRDSLELCDSKLQTPVSSGQQSHESKEGTRLHGSEVGSSSVPGGDVAGRDLSITSKEPEAGSDARLARRSTSPHGSRKSVRFAEDTPRWLAPFAVVVAGKNCSIQLTSVCTTGQSQNDEKLKPTSLLLPVQSQPPPPYSVLPHSSSSPAPHGNQSPPAPSSHSSTTPIETSRNPVSSLERRLEKQILRDQVTMLSGEGCEPDKLRNDSDFASGDCFRQMMLRRHEIRDQCRIGVSEADSDETSKQSKLYLFLFSVCAPPDWWS
ncbi:unnamed protein product [Protopolystoma xenopodis]|uniref:Uncharacterized protein n=1 Tax=Protopolystoma xenopodis TaxID=117903 RepID=A0A448WAY2_9PLAT|nr:unnamed protein product [Protopolystoma xenopodis]